jgi:hypothetical protein
MPLSLLTEGDIETPILTALGTVFKAELQTNIGSADVLKLRRLDQAPLQDDPTKTAPYLVYSTMPGAWEAMSDLDIAEIGGGVLYEIRMAATCGTPRTTSKPDANQAINTLADRITGVLTKHYDLSGILSGGVLASSDGTKFIDAMSPQMLELGIQRRTYGGGAEWYGEAMFMWKYNYMRLRNW